MAEPYEGYEARFGPKVVVIRNKKDRSLRRMQFYSRTDPYSGKQMTTDEVITLYLENNPEQFIEKDDERHPYFRKR